jgi:hypothetical protein
MCGGTGVEKMFGASARYEECKVFPQDDRKTGIPIFYFRLGMLDFFSLHRSSEWNV